jgi:pimeloyl-ACP methyl ester carboxylesterase
MHTRVARLCANRHPTGAITRDTPVIVVPGFMACDLSTALLRSYLRRRGHHALPWGFGRNVGPVDGLMHRLVDRIAAVADAAGEGVILVGHSLGGIYAREVAKAAPDVVRAVFTLGSPVRALSPQRREANAAILREIERASGRTIDDWLAQGWFSDLAASPPVRCVALYSKRDTVAPWQSCLGIPSRLLENVEVNVTHRRMVVSPTVFRAIGARMRRRPRDAATSLVA